MICPWAGSECPGLDQCAPVVYSDDLAGAPQRVCPIVRALLIGHTIANALCPPEPSEVEPQKPLTREEVIAKLKIDQLG